MGPVVGEATLAVYALLLAAGGIVGFLKAGSRPSLIAGLASAAVALVCLGVALAGYVQAGLGVGVLLALALIGVFGLRLRKTGKFMPSGLMLAVSLVAGIVLGVAALG